MSELGAASSSLIAQHAVATYFLMTFGISWTGAFMVAAPNLLRHQSVPKFAGLMMFPAMLLGPSLAGVFLTGVVDGRAGLRDLFSRWRSRFSLRWVCVLLLPPVIMLAVLLGLKTLVSAVYTPNAFVLGIVFGLPAGFFEEIGWMGFVFPKMRAANDGLDASVWLGLIWAVWHLPVIDYLGTATPHGAYWLPYFLAFASAMTAVRVLITWVYVRTNSLALSQLLHVSSTGSLVVLSPLRVSAAQEAFWYAIYGVALLIVVGIAVGWNRGLGLID